MKLIDRQILAVEETLEQFREEYEAQEDYHNQSKCILCKYFADKDLKDCGDCPIKLLIDREKACIIFMSREDTTDDYGNFEDIAGFLKSLLVSLELMRGGK